MDLPKIGQILTNEDMRLTHSVSSQGGMRKSNKTNSLVLTTSLESTYSDRWEGDILHYTGEGLSGDQQIKRQNKTLAESNHNGVTVFLYEKMNDNAYRFHGQVRLVDEPYQEQQTDEDDKLRNVWMFPIKPTEVPPSVPKPFIDDEANRAQKRLRKLAREALVAAARTDSGRARTNTRNVTTIQHHRSQAISLCIKAFADGICDLCESAAPFKDKNNEPYLECHHIQWLAKGGLDTLDNTVALCPNCHRKMHNLNLEMDVEKLTEVALSREEIIDTY